MKVTAGYGVSQIRSELFRKPMRTRRIGPHIAHGQRRSPFRSPMYEASFGRAPRLGEVCKSWNNNRLRSQKIYWETIFCCFLCEVNQLITIDNRHLQNRPLYHRCIFELSAGTISVLKYQGDLSALKKSYQCPAPELMWEMEAEE